MVIGEAPREGVWPHNGLDVERLTALGWNPLAFAQFVIKVHSRCNLACDYCYVYESADQGWRVQPKTMRRDVFAEACRMIRDHAQRFSVPKVSIVFHGGEPLLLGHRELEWFANNATGLAGKDMRVQLGVQTNGLLLDDAYLEIFDRWDVRVAVSLDGTRTGHDRHRRFRDGSGSYEAVTAGLSRLTTARFRRLYSGLLCVIDLNDDPVETYESLIGFDPPAVDFLLPHGNWTTPPPGRGADPAATPYADWLIAIFNRWYRAGRPETRIRLFDQIINLLLGGVSSSESAGLAPIRLAVIETDGSLEQVDTLKTTFPGAAAIGHPPAGNPLDEALWQPQIIARQIGTEALCQTCRDCPVHKVCGAGNYTHRYREDNGFKNPSVYCPDLRRLIEHVWKQICPDVAALVNGGVPHAVV